MTQVLGEPVVVEPPDGADSMMGCASGSCIALSPKQLPLARLAVGIFVAAQTMLLGLTINLAGSDDPRTMMALRVGMLVATVAVMLLLGLPLVRQVLALGRRGIVSMESFFLAGIAAAMGISVVGMLKGRGPVYFEVVNVLLVVYSVGQAIASHSRSRAISAAGSMLAGVARARLANGEVAEVTQIRKGDRIKVMPGELIPTDGIVRGGQSLVSAAVFSGEWASSAKRAGDQVLAGTACEDGALVIEATADGTDRRIDKLAGLILSACHGSSPFQRQAEYFVSRFFPAVILTALLTLVCWGLQVSWSAGVFNGLAVILVACPCAAGLAAPLATWTAIARLAEKGLLLKSAESLERLARVDGVIFDKTGTLADQSLQLIDLRTAEGPGMRELALTILAEVEQQSNHPVAMALRRLPRGGADRVEVLDVRILPGEGIAADLLVNGTARWLRLKRRPATEVLTIDATLSGEWLATAAFAERLRDSAQNAVRELGEMGLDVRVMTGDAQARSAGELCAPVTAGMTPEHKHAAAGAARRSLFVGDGINDAAAMAASCASIAMADGAAIAVEAADATLHGGDLSLVPAGIGLARRTVNVIRGNFAWAIAYNITGMAFAAAGLLHPVLASVLMSLSSTVVAWRSFNLGAGSIQAQRRPAAPPKARAVMWSAKPHWAYRAMHAVGLIGQGVILIFLARLAAPGGVAIVAVTLLGAVAIARWARRFPAWLDMTMAMVSLGGLGMNLGWWMDLHFDPAIAGGMVRACCMAGKTLDATTLQASTHWMYWMMLIWGVPAMYLLRLGGPKFSWRQWCGWGMLILGVPGMCFGMWAGAQLAMGLEIGSLEAKVVASYVLMMAGMCAGMLIPHALELAFGK